MTVINTTSPTQQGETKMNSYKIGQKVEATIEAQGMNKGERFVVLDRVASYTPFGKFVTYTIKNKKKELQIANAQFVLKAA